MIRKKLTDDEWEFIAKRVKNYEEEIPKAKKFIQYHNVKNRKFFTPSVKANINFSSSKTFKNNTKNKLNNFKKYQKFLHFSQAHNKREGQECEYFLPKMQRERNENQAILQNELKPFYKLSHSFLNPYEYSLKDIDAHIRQDYKNFHKRAMPYNAKPLTEAIMNLEGQHTAQDIEKALKSLDLPLKPLHISIHRDEGHKDNKTGKIIKNYHAHITFLNYDFKTHRTQLRTIHKAEFSKFKEKLAKALNMDFNEKSPNPRHLNRYQLEHRTQESGKTMLKEIRKLELEKFKSDLVQEFKKESLFKSVFKGKERILKEFQKQVKEFETIQELRQNNQKLDRILKEKFFKITKDNLEECLSYCNEKSYIHRQDYEHYFKPKPQEQERQKEAKKPQSEYIRGDNDIITEKQKEAMREQVKNLTQNKGQEYFINKLKSFKNTQDNTKVLKNDLER